MWKKSAIPVTSSPGSFSLKKKSQPRIRSSFNSKKSFSSTPTSPSRSTSMDLTSPIPRIDNKEVITITFRTIIETTKRLFEMIEKVKDEQKEKKILSFIELYEKQLPKEQRKQLLKRMDQTMSSIIRNINLPTCCCFLIENKICFDTYPQVLSTLCYEYYQLISLREKKKELLDEIIKSTSIILKEFSLLIELLDKDLQRYIIELTTILQTEKVSRWQTNTFTSIENIIVNDYLLLNLVLIINITKT